MSENMEEVMAIFQNRSHPTMIQINTVAYILEIMYYTMALVFAPAYMILSKFQIRILFIEILVLSITREVGVILRLIEAAITTLPFPWDAVKAIFTSVNLATVTQIDFSVFLIAMERLLATYRIRDYEKSFHHPILRILILIYVIAPTTVINYFVFFGGLKDPMANTLFLNALNIVSTATYVLGIIAMETSRILSIRQLKSEDRELSTSFQCKENLMVVKMIRPVFILLFITRLVQFLSKYYMFEVQWRGGAVALRIVTHLYNQSVAICFLLVPLLMLKNHANLTRFTRQTDVIEEVNSDVYFMSLANRWN